MNTRRKFAWKHMLSLMLALMLAIPAVQMSNNEKLQAEAATSITLSLGSGDGDIIAPKGHDEVVFGNQSFVIGTPTEGLSLVIWYDYAYDSELLEQIKQGLDADSIQGRLAEINVSNMSNYTYPCLYAGNYCAALYLDDEKVSNEVSWTVSSLDTGYNKACVAREYLLRELQNFPAEIDMSNFGVTEEWVNTVGGVISDRGATYMVPYYGLQYTWNEVEEDAVDENGIQILDEYGNPTKVTVKYLNTIIPTYWITEKEYKLMETYVDSALDVLLPENPTDEQKLVAVYFFETLLSNTVYTDNVTDPVNPVCCLLDKAGICDGYARTMEYLCRKVGLSCVKGGSGADNGGISHAWCTAYVNQNWYQFDPTWDIGWRDFLVDGPTYWMFQTDNYYLQNHTTNGQISWSQGGFKMPKCEDPYYTKADTGEWEQYVILGKSCGIVLPYEYTNSAGTKQSGFVWSDGWDICFSNKLYDSTTPTVLKSDSKDVVGFYFSKVDPEVFAWTDAPSSVLPGDTIRISGGAVGFMKDPNNANDKFGKEGTFTAAITKANDGAEVASYKISPLEKKEISVPEEAGTYNITVTCNDTYTSDSISFEVVEKHETKTISLGNQSSNNYDITIGKDYYILESAQGKEYHEFVGDYNIVQTEDLVYTSISVIGGFDNKITIDGVKLDSSFNALGAGSMELILKGENSFVGKVKDEAAMVVSEKGDFVISGTGTLTVTNEAVTEMPAIRMSANKEASLTIAGGIINAKGGNWNTAIGPAYWVSGSDLIIAGGTIYATAGAGLNHGLGGGYNGQCSKIYIFGGNIIARDVNGNPLNPIGMNVKGANKIATAYTDKRVVATPLVYDGGEAAKNKAVTSISIGDYTYNATMMKADENGKLYLYVPKGVKLANVKVTFGDTLNTDTPDYKVKRGDESPIWLYGNGGKNKTTLFTDLVAGTYTNAKGKTAKGAIVWVATPTGEVEIDKINHKVLTKSDASVITVSGKGAVTAKAEGKMYVLAIDTATFEQEVFEITVKAAPATVSLYRTADETPVDGDMVYSTSVVPYGGSVSFYVKGYTGKLAKTSNTVKVIAYDEITYSVTVPAKYTDYFTVTEGEGGKFTVTVSEDLKELSKNNKPIAVSLSVVCNQSGKKATFKITASNPVKTTVLAAQEGTTATKDETTGALHVTLDSALTAVQTGFIKETATPYDSTYATTDKTKIISIRNAEAFELNKNGDVVAVGKPTAEQKKISLAVDKATGGYKITAKKGTKPGTTAYFIIFHNSYNNGLGVGYQLVKVTAGEANHYTSATIAPTVETLPEGMDWFENEGSYCFFAPSADLAAQSLTVKVTTELANAEVAATDAITIYSLPSADEEYYDLVSVGETDADRILETTSKLSAGQKKVTMKLAKGKTDEFVINVAKKTPEGTRAYFAVFMNGECYKIISVTVGTPNEVQSVSVDLAEEGNDAVKDTVKVEKTSAEDAKIPEYTVTVPYNKAATKVILAETVSLDDNEAKQTDVNLLYAIGKTDGYKIEANKTLCTVTTVPSSAQKKITLKAVKNSRNYTLTVAKATPVGTESYFLIYHNATGLAIVKVVVTDAK